MSEEKLPWKERLNLFKGIKDMEDASDAPSAPGSENLQIEEKEEKTYTLYDRLAIDIAKLVAPDGAKERETYYKVGDEYTRTLFIHQYPPQVEDNWLRGVLRFPHPVDVSIYIQPLDIKKFVTKLRRRAAKDEASLEMQRESGQIVDARRESRYQDTISFIQAVENDITKPFQIGVFLTLRAHSLEELDKITEDLQRTLTSVNTRQARFRHLKGFNSNLPLMRNELASMQAVRLMHTQGLMSMFPFSSAELSHEEGVLVGVSMTTGSPIILNRFMQPEVKSPNTCVIGATGSGKSFFCKLEMLRWQYHGIPAIVLDPSGEYRELAEGVGGANVRISLDSGEAINPLDFSNAVRPEHNALREKIAFLIELLSAMLKSEDGGLIIDAVTRQIFDNALQETYRRYGYRADDPSTQLHANSQHMPLLNEVYDMLDRIAKTNRDPMIQQRVRPLLAALASFVKDGSLAPLFDQPTTVDLRSHFTNFDYSGLPEQYRAITMHSVLEFVRTSYFHGDALKKGQRLLLYVDEAQILMEEQETAHFLNHTARTCRKYGVGLTVMTQNVGVFTLNSDGSDNKIGQGILANCTIKVLLKQEPSEREAMLRAFDLTEGELARLLSGGIGEGLIYVGSESTWFMSRGMASREEYEMLTTTVSERAQIEASRQHQSQQQLLQQPQQVDPSHQISAHSYSQPPPPPPPPPTGDNPFSQDGSFDTPPIIQPAAGEYPPAEPAPQLADEEEPHPFG